jgi:monooxygenase
MHLQPKQGDQAPWVNSQNFRKERALFGKPLASDRALQFSAAADS